MRWEIGESSRSGGKIGKTGDLSSQWDIDRTSNDRECVRVPILTTDCITSLVNSKVITTGHNADFSNDAGSAYEGIVIICPHSPTIRFRIGGDGEEADTLLNYLHSHKPIPHLYTKGSTLNLRLEGRWKDRLYPMRFVLALILSKTLAVETMMKVPMTTWT